MTQWRHVVRTEPYAEDRLNSGVSRATASEMRRHHLPLMRSTISKQPWILLLCSSCLTKSIQV